MQTRSDCSASKMFTVSFMTLRGDTPRRRGSSTTRLDSVTRASLNITSLIRDANGTNDLVDKCSTAYRAGGWTTAVFGAGRLAYAGLAKGFSIFAASGRAGHQEFKGG
jgi:hypothetical protein